MRIPRRAVIPAAAAVVAAAFLPAFASQVAGGSSAGVTVTPALPSVTPGFASHARALGHLDSSARVDFSVMVRGQNEAALAPLAAEVSNPASPMFRHFLTRAQALAEFDPTPATTATVVSGLKALGLTVDRVSSDGRLVDVHATQAVVSAGLGVTFTSLENPDGQAERVAMNQPVLSSALKPLISGFVGLSATPVHNDIASAVAVNAYKPAVTTPVGGVTTAPAPALFAGRPCGAYFGSDLATDQPKYNGKVQARVICGYDPAAIRAAYRIPESGLTGAGVKIGIVDDYSQPDMVADTNEFSSLHGIPQLASGQYVDNSDPAAKATPEADVQVADDPTCNLAITGGCVVGDGAIPVESPQGWSGEQSLDVEMVHLMAPAATIEYYGGDQGIGLQPLEAEFTQAIAADTAQFISDSWGINEGSELVTQADQTLMTTELQLGATLGIGASFSSGDDADNVEVNGSRQADFPSSTPYGTSVGGTTLVVGAKDTYVGETYWGTRLEPKTKDGTGWDGTPVAAPTSTGMPTGPGTLAGGGGGGVSADFAEPSWQDSVVPASLTTDSTVTSPGRVVPDISLVADSSTGVLVGQTQTDIDGVARYSEFRIGGTSVSSPLFGGLMALVIQKNGGKSLGFVSPTLYTAYKNSPDAFRDPGLGRNLVNIRTDYTNSQDPSSAPEYHLRLFGQLSTLHDLVGYDDSTGLGTPCAPTFAAAVISPTVAATPVAGCGLPLASDVTTPATAALQKLSRHVSKLRVGGRGPVIVGKTYTYDALLFTTSGRGAFASPAKRAVYIYLNGKRIAKVYTVADKHHPYQANAFYKIKFKKPGVYYVSAAFAGATDLTASKAKAQKVVARFAT